jgi:hypothetical protein
MTRHAPQARFDRMVTHEKRSLGYTSDQMHNWTETDWNWHFRMALQDQGFRAFHVREASETGVADLIVYRKLAWVTDPLGKQDDYQVVECWMELKTENSKSASNIRPGQVQFMREHWRCGRNALFVMYDRTVRMLAVHQGDLKGRVKMCYQSPYATQWQEVFNHFKKRRVSV